MKKVAGKAGKAGRPLGRPSAITLGMLARELTQAPAARAAGLSAPVAEAVAVAFVDLLTGHIARGQTVYLRGLGTLEARLLPARSCRHPASGLVVDVPATLRGQWRASHELRRGWRTSVRGDAVPDPRPDAEPVLEGSAGVVLAGPVLVVEGAVAEGPAVAPPAKPRRARKAPAEGAAEQPAVPVAPAPVQDPGRSAGAAERALDSWLKPAAPVAVVDRDDI